MFLILTSKRIRLQSRAIATSQIKANLCHVARPEAQPAMPEAQPAMPEAQPAMPEAQPARSKAQPTRSEARPIRSEAQPANQPSLRLQAWLAGPQARLDGPEGGIDRQTGKQKISSFYRTLFPIGAAALLPPPPCKPRKCHFKIKVKQGKGTADQLMPLGYTLFVL